MKRMRFKFLVSDSLLLCVENQEWFDPDLSLEQFLKKQWGLVPCAPQSFPERESGFYYIREGIVVIPKNAVVPPGTVI